jgi:hypothetical protein
MTDGATGQPLSVEYGNAPLMAASRTARWLSMGYDVAYRAVWCRPLQAAHTIRSAAATCMETQSQADMHAS